MFPSEKDPKAREIVRDIVKKSKARKHKLPSSFDECLAYFTGYASTSVSIDTVDTFITLAAWRHDSDVRCHHE